MLDKNNNMTQRLTPINRQQGASTLFVSLIIVSMLMLLGISSSRLSIVEVKMSNNSIDKQKATAAAEAAISVAWQNLASYDFADYMTACTKAGLYDLRTSVVNCDVVDPDTGVITAEPTTKNSVAWESIKNANQWDWTDTSHHFTLTNKLSSTSSILQNAEQVNPMQIAQAPQYIIGVHDLVYVYGSGLPRQCFPVSIIGAGTGNSQTTQVLIEAKAMPDTACYEVTTP